MCPHEKSLEIFNDPGINVSHIKKSGNLFNNTRIMCPQ